MGDRVVFIGYNKWLIGEQSYIKKSEYSWEKDEEKETDTDLRQGFLLFSQIIWFPKLTTNACMSPILPVLQGRLGFPCENCFHLMSKAEITTRTFFDNPHILFIHLREVGEWSRLGSIACLFICKACLRQPLFAIFCLLDPPVVLHHALQKHCQN